MHISLYTGIIKEIFAFNTCNTHESSYGTYKCKKNFATRNPLRKCALSCIE